VRQRSCGACAASLRAIRTALQARRAAAGRGVSPSRSNGRAASFSGSSRTRIQRVVSSCCQLVRPLSSARRFVVVRAFLLALGQMLQQSVHAVGTGLLLPVPAQQLPLM